MQRRLNTRGENKCFFGVYYQECVKDVVSSLDYPRYILCNVWDCMSSADTLRFRWWGGYMCNTYYDHHQTGSINISHAVVIFFFSWLCIWGGCTITFCRLLHIDPGKAGFLCSLLCSVWCVQILGYITDWMSYSFTYYTISFSLLCLPVIFCRVCV